MEFYQIKNLICLKDLKFTNKEFRILEPTLEDIPVGYEGLVYSPGKYHEIYGTAVPLIKKSLYWEEGDRYFSRYEEFKLLRKRLDEENLIENKYEIEILKNTLSYQECRKLYYPNIDDLVIALWEYIVEEKTEKADFFQKQRLSVKEMFPKG